MMTDERWGRRRFNDPERKVGEPFVVHTTREQLEALEASLTEARLAHPRPDENRAFTRRVLGDEHDD